MIFLHRMSSLAISFLFHCLHGRPSTIGLGMTVMVQFRAHPVVFCNFSSTSLRTNIRGSRSESNISFFVLTLYRFGHFSNVLVRLEDGQIANIATSLVLNSFGVALN